MTKRVFAFLMVIAMVFSLLPTVVVAGEVAATPGYKMVLQKAHNQTSVLDVDVYLQANTADQGDVTTVQFDVVSETLSLAGAVDAEGNSLIGSGARIVYAPTEAAAPVSDTGMTLVATISLDGENAETTNWADLVTVNNIEVVANELAYTDGGEGVSTEPAGAVTVEKIPFTACEAHGTSGWTAGLGMTTGTLEAGSYYLTEDVQLTGTLNVAAGAEVTVCLNGHDITAKDATRIFELTNAGATLNICDCTATGEGKDYTAGMLIPKHNQGGAMRSTAAENVEINFYGGIVDGTSSSKKEASVALVIGSTLNMLGGKVQNFDAGLTSGGYHYGPIIVRGKKDGADGMATIANVTFVNCGSAAMGGAPGGSDRTNGAVLTVENVTVLDSAAGAYAVEIGENRFKSVTLKGDCKFDAPVFVGKGETVTLALSANADVNIVTDDELTEEQFNQQVKMAEGCETVGNLVYENKGVYVTYENGKFVFAEGHTIKDKYAAGIVFKVWDKTDSLPKEGNWYLENDVTVSATVDVEGPLNLDLNGKTITASTARPYDIWVGTLSLYDGTSTFDAEGNWTAAGTGNITGYTDIRGVIRVCTGGVFNLYSGKISGNGADGSWKVAPAVYVSVYETGRATQPGAIFNMYGGEIANNKSAAMGAAIGAHVNDNVTVPEGHPMAQINIHGGKIYGNTTQASGVTNAQGEGTISARENTVVKITGGEISGNTAVYGGAVFLKGHSKMEMTGGVIKENTALANGGAIYMGGTSTLDITGGEFDKNQVTAGTGGFLYFGSSKTANISNVDITNNYSSSRGGAILLSSTGTVTLNKCNVTGNSAGGIGSAVGGADKDKATLKLVDTIITGNNCTNGSYWSASGAVMLVGQNLIVSGKTVIAGNTATKGTGAKAAWQNLLFNKTTNRTSYIQVDELAAGSHIEAFNLGAKDLTAAQAVTIAEGGSQTDWDCGWVTYTEASANDGSAIDADHSGSISRVNGEFTFGHWHGDQEYTAITSADDLTAIAEGGNYYLANDITTSAAWSPVDGTVLCFAGHKITSSARPVVSVEGTAAKSTVTFEDCTGVYTANDEYIGGGITTTTTASGSGHGLRAAGTNVVNWNGGKIFGITVNATGSVGGAAMWINGATVHINGGAVCNNTMTTTTTSTLQGIVQINAGTLDINGGSFYGNTTSGGGTTYGVVRRAGGTVSIDNAKFFDNEAVTAAAAYTNGTLTNCEFRNNSVSTKGGAVRASGALTLKNCKFTENVGAGGAGAVFTESTTLTMTGCEFTGNEATGGRGGAVDATHSSGNYTITDCVFKDNSSSTNGGALNVESATTVNIKGCKFEGNTATSLGGAICTRGNGMTMNIAKNDSGVGCTFTGNSAAKGGAINFDTYNRYTNTRNISDATFTGNTATGGGGAVYINCGTHASNTGVLTMNVTGSTFTGNKGSDGSAFSLNGYTVTNMDSCTITGNESSTSYYGAIFVQNLTSELTLKGKMNITGNTNADKTNNTANLYMRDGGNNPIVTITDLDPASTIGVNATDARYEAQPVIGTAALVAGSDADILKCIVSDNNDRFRTYVDADGNLMLTNYVAANGTTYQTLTEALTAMADAGATEFQLQAGSEEEIELPATITKLDLNGASIAKVKVAEGATLDLIDSATNDYDISDGVYGKTTVDGEVNPYYYDEAAKRHYVVLTDADGVSTAHRIYVSITSKVLRPASYGAGFKAIFAADEMITETAKYGIKFTGYAPDAAERESADSWYDASFTGMLPGKQNGAPNQKIVAFKNAISKEDTHRWDAALYGVPYVTIGDVEVTGVEQSLIMQDLATNALAKLSADNEVYQLIEAMMADCGVSAI